MTEKTTIQVGLPLEVLEFIDHERTLYAMTRNEFLVKLLEEEDIDISLGTDPGYTRHE